MLLDQKLIKLVYEPSKWQVIGPTLFQSQYKSSYVSYFTALWSKYKNLGAPVFDQIKNHYSQSPQINATIISYVVRTLECMYIVSTYKSVRSSTWVCFVYRPIWWRRGGHSATRAAPSTKSGSTQAVLFPRLFFSVVQQLYFHKVVPQFWQCRHLWKWPQVSTPCYF